MAYVSLIWKATVIVFKETVGWPASEINVQYLTQKVLLAQKLYVMSLISEVWEIQDITLVSSCRCI